MGLAAGRNCEDGKGLPHTEFEGLRNDSAQMTSCTPGRRMGTYASLSLFFLGGENLSQGIWASLPGRLIRLESFLKASDLSHSGVTPETF